jgi:hypothetical protein
MLTNGSDLLFEGAASGATFPAIGAERDAHLQAAGAETASSDAASLGPWGILEWFAVGQTVLPALLFIPGNQPFRTGIRASAFLCSLLGLAVWYLRGTGSAGRRHPAGRWLSLAFFVLAAMIFHPGTGNLMAGAGQIALYVAVFAPVFWVPAFVTSRRQLSRVLAILLVCNGLNSAVGVLQVYDPQRWMPAEFSSTFALNRDILRISTYQGPDGRPIVRPPGLYDTPGAVCGAGAVAALLGLIFAAEPRPRRFRVVALALSTAGIAAVYLSHVRASAAVGLGMMLTYLALLLFQRQHLRATSFGGLAIVLVFVAFVAASTLGGQSVRDRFTTLFQNDPRDLYYSSRGAQLENAFSDLLAAYPFGAGLARWGVMTNYAGGIGSRRLWAEIQPAAWILDGGLVLLVLYGTALLSTLRWHVRLLARLREPNDRLSASAVVAANVGSLVLVATFVPFTTQLGLQFWFLEGLLCGAMADRLAPKA